MKNILVALGLLIVAAPLLFAGNAGMMGRGQREDPLEGQPAPQPTLYDGNLRRTIIPYRQPALLVFFSPNDPTPLRTAEQMLREFPKARCAGYAIANLRAAAGGKRPPQGNPPGGGTGNNAAGERNGAQYVFVGQAYGKGSGQGGQGKQARPGGNRPALSPQAMQQLASIQTALPILLDLSGEATRDFSARAGFGVLIDERGTVRARGQLNDQDRDRFTDMLALFSGDPPERYGWRDNIVFALDVAQGKRDNQGRPIVPGKGKAMVAPPQQSARALSQLLPPTELNVQANYEGVPETSLKAVKEAVDYALQAWTKALPDCKFQAVDDRRQADVIIGFKTEVLDPRDENGIRTVCFSCRTLDEEAPGKGKPPPGNARPNPRAEHRMKTIVNIGFGHSTDGVQHNQRAVAHMAGAGIGAALGLDDRRDAGSVMNPNADKGNPALTPSRDDLTILQGIANALHYEVGKLHLQMNRTQPAEDAFAQIAKTSRYAELARVALIEAGVTPMNSEGKGKSRQ